MALLAMAFGGLPAVAIAHPLSPSLLELREGDAGAVDARWRRPQVVPRGEALALVWPAACEPVAFGAERQAGEGIERVARLACAAETLRGATIGVDGFVAGGSNVVLDVATEAVEGAWLLHAERPRVVLGAGTETGFVAALWLGVDHLLGGADHLLFVLGLLLLVGRARDLALLVTGFTLGHSVSLTLATLAGSSVPGPWVEVAIAATLVAVALEALEERGSTRWRDLGGAGLCAALGLLHGLGFAGAFGSLGLSARELAAPLLGFNVGLELAQLGALAVVGALVAVGRRSAKVRALPWRAAVAYGIGGMGAFWIIERAPAALGG